MKRVCWMTLKCSAEPKRRDVAQITVFAAESEPIWLKDRIHPKGQESDFQYRAAQRTLKSRYLTSTFLYALRSASYGITSRDFVCHRSPSHSRNRLPLWGCNPQSPERRNVYGERYTNCCPGDGKGKRENPVQGPKMRAENNRICQAKSVGVRAERGSTCQIGRAHV